jgi:hypothetical protein
MSEPISEPIIKKSRKTKTAAEKAEAKLQKQLKKAEKARKKEAIAKKREEIAKKKEEAERKRETLAQKKAEKERKKQEHIEKLRETSTSLWPIRDFKKHIDLFPFSKETFQKAYDIYENDNGAFKDDDVMFWMYLYKKYSDESIPYWKKEAKLKDPNSNIVPTMECPWSTQQLLDVLEEKDKSRSECLEIYNQNHEFREKIHQLKPFYTFDQTELALSNPEILQMAAYQKYTQYIPWAPEKILHFMVGLFSENNIPVKHREYLTEEDEMKIRLSLLKHWNSHKLLRFYVSRLIPESAEKLNYVPVAPLATLLMSYAKWDNEDKELPSHRLHNIWANDLLIRTYAFYNNTTYFKLLSSWRDNPKDYAIYNTPTGVLVLKKSDTAMLALRGMDYSEFKCPGNLSWTKNSFFKHTNELLEQASQIVSKGKDVLNPLEEDMQADYDENEHSGLVTRQLKTAFRNIEEINSVWNGFLHNLYRTNQSFQQHTSIFAARLESLKYLYLNTSIPGEKKEDRINRVEKLKPKKLQEELTEWASKGKFMQDIIRAFEQDSRVDLHTTVPLFLDSLRYQRYIKKTWQKYILPEVSPYPERSTCEDSAGTRVGDRVFITPDNAQYFFNANFNPGSFSNGEIVVHSVGSGKTCLSIRVASDFARAGFNIVWVTKTSLKNQVLKNHVSEICNLLIREEFDRILWLEGEAAANNWLSKLPSQKNFQSVLSTLQGLGMNWINLSYRQLSNALEEEPMNQLGRDWNKHAALAAVGDTYDPLRKTLLIIDEAHKMFTGELDKTELPNVQIIHERLQQSYQNSGPERCRVLFLTATPTTDTFLPLFNMLNMLHSQDVFPYQMATIDPHIKVDEGLMEHIQKIREENRILEKKAACEMFPMRSCQETNNEESDDEELEESDINAFFDSKSIIGGGTFNPKDLSNNLEAFWNKAFGLISYYNISADYSKFPRTEYMPIIMPSATMTQERLIAAELIAPWEDLSALANKIRQISAWAAFQSVNSESRKPTQLDQIIMDENARHTYFEPTFDDLQARLKLLQEMIETEQSRKADNEDVELLKKYELRVKDLNEKKIDLEQKYIDLMNDEIEVENTKSRKVQKSVQKGLLTKELRKVSSELNSFNDQIQRLSGNINYFESRKAMQIKYLEKKIDRVQRRLRAMQNKSRKKIKTHNHHDIEMFLNPLTEEDFEEKVEEKKGRNNTKKLKKLIKKGIPEEEEEEEAKEEELQDIFDEEEIKLDEKLEQKLDKKRKLPTEYFVKKTWLIDSKLPLPSNKPKFPKRHFFDQPDYFDADQFLKDIPLYSPKLAKLLEVIHDNDLKDMDQNPEASKNNRLRKRMIFCEDIHAIRAVAGGLMANGWKFGMKREHVYWQKEYFDAATNKKFGKTLTSDARTLTWLPYREESSKHDYKRFLILTRSKIGGVSGATLNDYAVQIIGAKGDEATYNHKHNIHGKDWRIIIIDRNFIEGIDLPSTYADLFDPVLSQSTRTQIVGRVSRFCGMLGLPFIPNEGWPQKIYRYGLKFHTVGLHLTSTQVDKLRERVENVKGPFAAIIPKKFREGFVDKIEKNLFSPLELQVLLDDNMEAQRIKKKTLDVYMALMEKSSIGALLYAPAMKNLEASKHELDELLLEEEETENEYRQEVFNRDKKRQSKINYQLRSQNRNLMEQWNIDDARIFKFLEYHVSNKFRRTPPDERYRLKEDEVLKNYFERYVKPDMNDAELITVSPQLAFDIMRDMFLERVNYAENIKKIKELKKQKLSEDKDYKDIKAHIKATGGSKPLTLSDIRKLDAERIDKLWDSVQLTLPHVDRDKFLRAIARMMQRKSRKVKQKSRKDNKLKDNKPKEKTDSKKSRKAYTIKSPEMKAVEKAKKDMKIDVRTLRKSKSEQDTLIQKVLAAHPDFSEDKVISVLKSFLNE